MLVACMLVNKTTWETAEGTFYEVFGRWPGPVFLAVADLRTLRSVVRRLGLVTARSRNLKAMASAWMQAAPRTAEDVALLPGCGKYAADSWAIFVQVRTDVHPDDGKLTWYLKRMMI